MFNETEIIEINKEFNIRQAKRRHRNIKVWSIVLVVLIAVVVTLAILLQGILNDAELGWIIPTYGSMLIVGAAVGFIVSFFYKSKLPFKKYVLPTIYNKININEGTDYDCNSTPSGVPFNRRGGLFVRYATTVIRRHVKGTTADSIPMDIYDTKLYTSNKNSTRTYFDGIYYVLNKDFNTNLQVRTEGKPSVKGTKFYQIEKYNNIKVYKPEGETVSSLDEEFIAYFNRILKSPKVKSLFISVVRNEVHLALWTINPQGRACKEITKTSLDALYNYYVNEPKILDSLLDSINY